MTKQTSVRFYVLYDEIALVKIGSDIYGNTYRMLDSSVNPPRTVCATPAMNFERRERIERLCKRLNDRDFARTRQFGESRKDFAARRAASTAVA